MEEDLEYNGPCHHCGNELWVVADRSVPRSAWREVHGFELPEALGFLALAGENGWSSCPICGSALCVAPLALN